MENVLNLNPIQMLLLLLQSAWVTIIFPFIVIRKLNYIMEFLESQFPSEETPDQPVI